MDKHDLYNWYNATSTEHPVGSDELETYEHWLEKQLISRIERLEALEKVNGDNSKKSNCNIHSVRASALEKLLKHIDYCNAAMDECKELEYDKEKIRINGQKEGLQAAIDILEHLP